MTFSVPIVAAFSKGISRVDHGVFTIRSLSPSMAPLAPWIKNPTQSIRRILQVRSCSSSISTCSFGTNLGSVVMMVRPCADCGNSSTVRRRAFSSLIFGSTICSMNCLIKVDLPVRTGPTTPMYISPFVLLCISLYKENLVSPIRKSPSHIYSNIWDEAYIYESIL